MTLVTGPLDLAVENSDSTMLLRIAGDLDLATSVEVTAALDQLDVARTKLLVLDLQEVAFLDLTGLRTVVDASDHFEHHQIHVTVIKPHGFAGRMFTLTGANRELHLVDSG